jgi:hypothetical protein
MVLTIEQAIENTIHQGLGLREELVELRDSTRSREDFAHYNEVKAELKALRTKYSTLVRIQRNLSKGN